MDERLADNATSIIIRGVVAIAFGILAFLVPGLTLLGLVLLFGAYALVDGVFSVITGIRRHANGRRDWLLVLGGIAGIAAGIIAFVWPGISALALLAVIAAWALISGAAEIAAAIRGRQFGGRWLLLLDGIVSVVFGILLIVYPNAGALAVVWLIGAYAIVSGVLLLSLGFQARTHAGGTTRPTATAAS
jgi:uncharacterized membrane protein HdeD (DUF308 family)